MLLLLTLLSVILCCGADPGKIALYPGQETILEMRKQAETCGQEYGVEAGALRELMTWSFQRDEPHVRFASCVVRGVGLVRDDNHLDFDRMLRLVPLNGTVDDYRRTLDECDRISREDPLDTVYEKGACINQRYQLTATKPKEA